MNVTHQDVIDYIEFNNDDNHYKVRQGKLHITEWVEFHNFYFSTLPSNMVFEHICDLCDSEITYVPEDIVLQSSLLIRGTSITTLPVLYISGGLNVIGTNTVLHDGTYIGTRIFSSGSPYMHLHSLIINGYFFGSGILS